MGTQTPKADKFESHLQRGRQTIAAARNDYAAIESVESVPDSLIEAIAELETRFEALERTLEVAEEDIARAERAVERGEVLSETMASLKSGQHVMIEASLSRLEDHLWGIKKITEENDISDSKSNNEMLNKNYEVLKKLHESGHYERITNNERVTPSTLDAQLRTADFDLYQMEAVSDQSRAETYAEIAERLLDDIHSMLADLEEDSEIKTQYADELASAKGWLSEAKDFLKNGEDSEAAHTARVGLDGCLSVHYLLAEEQANQYAAKELRQTIGEYDIDVSTDHESAIDSKQSLLEAIGKFVAAESRADTSERIQRLLNEYDGSVDRMAAATEYDTETIVEHLLELYKQGKIEDIPVEIS